MTASFTRRQIHYLAQECMWQRSEELSVSWMADALTYALKYRNESPTVEHVLKLGALVEPEVNRYGYRQCWVGVRNGA